MPAVGSWTEDFIRHCVTERKPLLYDLRFKEQDRAKYLREFAAPYRKLVERKAPFYLYVDHPFNSRTRRPFEDENDEEPSQVKVLDRKVCWFDWRRSEDSRSP